MNRNIHGKRKAGFLLTDALLAVCIVSLCAFLTASVVSQHEKINQAVKEKMDEMEERLLID